MLHIHVFKVKFCPVSNKSVHIWLFPIAMVVFRSSLCATCGWYMCECLCLITELILEEYPSLCNHTAKLQKYLNVFNKPWILINVQQILCNELFHNKHYALKKTLTTYFLYSVNFLFAGHLTQRCYVSHSGNKTDKLMPFLSNNIFVGLCSDEKSYHLFIFLYKTVCVFVW